MPTDAELVLEHLPSDGAPRLVDDVRERAGLTWRRASVALVSLSCDRRVSIRSDAAGTWARRLPQEKADAS